MLQSFPEDRGKYTYANGDEFMGLWDKGIKLSGTFYYMVWEPNGNERDELCVFLVDVFLEVVDFFACS